MKLIKYLETWYGTDAMGNSRALYAAGQHYPPHADSATHVAMGIAQEFDVTQSPEATAVLADEALAVAVAAVAAADAANNRAAAAEAAAEMAEHAATESATEAG